MSTKLREHGLGKLVGPSVDLIGGARALKLGDYELVVEQLQHMASYLQLDGLSNVNAEQLRKGFAESGKIALPSRSRGGLIRQAFNVIDQDPEHPGYNPSILEVLFIEIQKKYLKSANIGKGDTLVYSADQFRIQGRGYLGGEEMEDEYEQVQRGLVPVSLIYNV